MEVRHCLKGMVAVATLLVALPAGAQERLVQHGIDRDAGAIVRVFKTTAGGRIEVETPDLKLTKAVAGQKVTTTMRGRGEELVITFDQSTLSVSSPAGRVSARREQPGRLEQARTLIARSALAARAAAVIGKLTFGGNTPVQPMLLTTRAFLLAAAGARDVSLVPAGWTPLSTPTARVVKAGFSMESDLTPTQCWEAYTKEAIAAWMEYEDCMRDVKWYEFLDAAACATIYDMRAIGAFSWWLSCVSLG